MPKEAFSPRFTLKLPPVLDEPRGLPPGVVWRGTRREPTMDRLQLPPMQQVPELSNGEPVYTSLYKGHLYKTQLGSSLPDLSSRLQRQRQRLPRQYEKISFQVSADRSPGRSSRCLPLLTPRSPVIVERRAARPQHAAASTPSDSHSTVVEIHADLLDQTFVQHAKPGARPPWKPDCFCPRCGFMRQQWVHQNRKPYRPFSRQREPTFLQVAPLGRERSRLGGSEHAQKLTENSEGGVSVEGGAQVKQVADTEQLLHYKEGAQQGSDQQLNQSHTHQGST